MAEQTNNSGGTPAGGAPGAEPAVSPPSSFVRDRVAQMAEKMQQPAPAAQPAQSAVEAGQQQQQTPPAEQKIKIGDAEYDPADVRAAIAERAEQQVRKQHLPQAAEGYEVKNSADFKLPENVRFEFDMKDPTLAAARKFAMDRGLDQETFSGMLDLFVASKTGELLNQAQARQRNLDALGAAGPARIRAVATWLQATAGPEGAAVANFISQYPSAPIVKAVETLIRRFTNSGIDFSQSHRAQQEEPGKIPGYDQMSFVQRRVAQQQIRMQTERDYGRAPTTRRKE